MIMFVVMLIIKVNSNWYQIMMNHLSLNWVEPVTRYPQDAKPVKRSLTQSYVCDDNYAKFQVWWQLCGVMRDGYRLFCPLVIVEKMAWPCWWVSPLNSRFTWAHCIQYMYIHQKWWWWWRKQPPLFMTMTLFVENGNYYDRTNFFQLKDCSCQQVRLHPGEIVLPQL